MKKAIASLLFITTVACVNSDYSIELIENELGLETTSASIKERTGIVMEKIKELQSERELVVLSQYKRTATEDRLSLSLGPKA